MEGVYQWAMGVSLCAVVVCIVEMLLSDTALEKTVRFVLGSFLLSAVILPLGGAVRTGVQDIPWEQYQEEALPNSGLRMMKQRQAYVEQSVAALVDKTLLEHGISAAEITVQTDIDEDNCISMITAEVMLPSVEAPHSREVSRWVREELGIECRTVIVEG